MRTSLPALTIPTLLLVASAAALDAQQVRIRREPGGGARTIENREVSAEERTAVIEAFLEATGELYLFPDRVDGIAEQLREHARAGKFDAADDAQSFSRQVTDDMREITGDLHFSLRYDPARVDPMLAADAQEEDGATVRRIGFGSGAELPPEDSPIYRAVVGPYLRRNFDLRKLEVLGGNIGYLRIDTMPPLEPAKPTVDAAMAFLAHTDALVLDLRDTPGGVGGFIPYLMSYFFAEDGKVLFVREWGAEGRVDEYTTAETVGGKRRPDVPLYVLTSSATGSAAENLAFTLKHHGRATIVGETTAGGGHSARGAPIEGGFLATIPAARVVHPVTGQDFEGDGVQPDLAVPASEALFAARRHALEALLADAAPPLEAELSAALAELEVEERAATRGGESVETLSEYAGVYGPRTITVEGGELRLQREGGPKLALERVGGDRFRIRLPRGARAMGPIPDVRFDRDGGDEVTGLSLVRQDGSIEDSAERAKPGGS